MEVRLRVSTSATTAFTFQHAGPRITIGRNPEAELSLGGDANGVVSWQHARIELSDTSASLTDLGSSNGTFYNGERLEGRTPLQVGDVISLGQSGPQLEVVSLGAKEASPATPPAQPTPVEKKAAVKPAVARTPPPEPERKPAASRTPPPDLERKPAAAVRTGPPQRWGMMVGAGLAVLLVAGIGFWLFRARHTAPPGTSVTVAPTAVQPTSPAETVTVWVLKQDLPANTVLEEPEQWFEQREVAKDQEPADAVRDLGQLRGLSLARNLAAQQIVTLSAVVRDGVSVWVAREPLPAWTRLDAPERQLQRRDTPRSQVPAQALTDLAKLKGQVLTRPLPAQQPVVAADLQFEPVRQWNCDGPVIKVAFTSAGQALTCSHPPPTRTTLVHILLVMDSDARDIGSTVLVDERNLKLFFARSLATDRYRLTVLNGKAATAQSILSYYRGLQVSPSEALLFCYSGHGATDPAKGHFLALTNGGWLLRAELLAEMLKKQARLTCVLTDCCANIVKYKDPGRSREASVNNPILDALLFRHRGLVDVNACKKGETAKCAQDIGGVFSFAFMTECNEPPPPNRLVTWNEMFSRVHKRVSVMEPSQHPEALTPLDQVQTFELGRQAAPLAAQLQLWEVATGKETLRLAPVVGVTRSLSVSADGRTAVTGGEGGAVQVWDTTTGKARREFSAGGEVAAVCLTPDGRRLVAGSRDGKLTVWEADSGQRLHALDLGQPLGALAVSGGPSPAIAVGLANGQIRWFPQGLEQPAVTWQSHTAAITGLALTPDGKQLISCGQDKQVIRWDCASGKPLTTAQQAAPCRALAYATHANLILLGGEDGTLAILDGQSGQALLNVKAHAAELTSIAVAPEGTQFITTALDQTTKLWKLPK